MTERDEEGLFKSQGPHEGFDEETAEEIAGEHSWNNHRKRNLKRLGLWERVKDE